MNDFLGGRCLVHLINVVWTLRRQLIQVGLADDDEQNQMSRQKLRSGFDNLGRHRGFRQVGDPNYKAPPLLIVQ